MKTAIDDHHIVLVYPPPPSTDTPYHQTCTKHNVVHGRDGCAMCMLERKAPRNGE
jgi:hypothetical protein